MMLKIWRWLANVAMDSATTSQLESIHKPRQLFLYLTLVRISGPTILFGQQMV
jgi:hypothetical protein